MSFPRLLLVVLSIILFSFILVTPAYMQAPHGWVSPYSPSIVTYTANYGYVGSYSFTYTFRDSLWDYSTGTANINVLNQAPIANTDFYTVHASLLLTPMQNDTDPDGDGILFDSIATQPQHGTLFYGVFVKCCV